MIKIFPPQENIILTVDLPGSKSLSNRMLMIREISKLPLHFKNLSDSEDTVLLAKALGQIHNKTHGTVDISHAGTDMRFLTAYLAAKEGDWIITGSERMKERPIAELVTSLKELGAKIEYLEKDGFPPLKIKGTNLFGKKIEINGNISSQFISSLILIAPVVQNGIEIEIKEKIVSYPYIRMTIELLKQFGVQIEHFLNKIIIKQSDFKAIENTIAVEADWSSASYWYSIVALSQTDAEITLSNLHEKSLQADSVLPKIYENLGVRTEFNESGIKLTKSESITESLIYDFTDCPDIAQTIAVTCAGLQIPCKLNGLQTLKIKETDRIDALKKELEKLNFKVQANADSFEIQPTDQTDLPANILINTYNDHRMALSFAPLSLVYPGISIENPDVVNKSYPAFWDDLNEAGFSLD